MPDSDIQVLACAEEFWKNFALDVKILLEGKSGKVVVGSKPIIEQDNGIVLKDNVRIGCQQIYFHSNGHLSLGYLPSILEGSEVVPETPSLWQMRVFEVGAYLNDNNLLGIIRIILGGNNYCENHLYHIAPDQSYNGAFTYGRQVGMGVLFEHYQNGSELILKIGSDKVYHPRNCK